MSISRINCNFEGCTTCESVFNYCSSCCLHFCHTHCIGCIKIPKFRFRLLCISCITDGKIENGDYTYHNVLTPKTMTIDEIHQIRNTGTLLTKGCPRS